MRKILKKAAMALTLALVVSGMAPAAKTTLAATSPKAFTYAEQVSGRKVTELKMEVGDKEDLRFIGVPDYTKYDWNWVSSNESVAVVDRGGVITAIGEGVTCIRLVVGDETVYTSEGVIVYVGARDEILLGTSEYNTFTSKTMEVRGTMDLNYYGFKEDASKYLLKWTSTNPTVASVTKDGVVLAKKAGLTTIQLSFTNLYKDEVFYAVPVAVQIGSVAATPTVAPTKAPTVAPTKAPTVAPTQAPAKPTVKPTQAPTPTVTVTPEYPSVTPNPTVLPVKYSVTIESDSCLLVNFNDKVEYAREDIELFKVIAVGNSSYEDDYDKIKKVELNKTGTELRIYSDGAFENSAYILRIGGETEGTKFTVNVGAPNRLVISYECLGKENTAYACKTEDDDNLDIPVNLSYKLYYNTIEITEDYEAIDIEYEVISISSEDNVEINGDSIYFYEPNERVVLRANYVYENANGREQELTSNTVVISAKSLGDYAIQTPQIAWTIVHKDFEGKIDWNEPVHEVVASEDDYKIVALIADNYGNKYATDERGVDPENGIYSIDDDTQLFAKKGYMVQFLAEMEDKFFVFPDGELFTYQKVDHAFASLKLSYFTNNGTEKTKNIGTFDIEILPERELDKISVADDKKSISLTTQALPGFEERFCETDIKIELFDQYGEPWTGEYELEVTANISDVTDAIDSGRAAVLNGNVLHINAEEIDAVTTRSSVKFTVKEIESGAKVVITVNLESPKVSNGQIQVTTWKVDAEDVAITFDSENLFAADNEAVIEIFQMSNTIEVGLETSNIYLLDDKNHKFEVGDNYSIGDYYVLITGPDGKVVQESSGSDLGVWVDEANHCIKVNLTALSKGLMLDFLDSGKYNVTVYKITNVTSSRITTTKKAVSFQVSDETKEVSYKTMRGGKSTIDVSSETDLEAVKEVVAEQMVFRLGDSTWTDLTAEMITDVTFKYKETGSSTYVIIRSVEFAVPIDGKDPNILAYSRTVKNLNKSIRVGVEED